MTDHDNQTATTECRVLGIAGSLRAGSWNRMLLASAQTLAPEGMDVTVFGHLGAIPMYSGDHETDPPSVADLKAEIDAADALLIVTPEYNFGVPGVLKNALDWASTPPGRSVMNGKPIAIMGASPGMLGTARAQQQLRLNLGFTRNPVVPYPEVLLAKAHECFDEQGDLTDPVARRLVEKLLVALLDLSRRQVPWPERDRR